MSGDVVHLHESASSAHARVDSHEALCALRYDMILSRIGRLEQVLYWSAGLLITGMGGLIVTLLLRGK